MVLQTEQELVDGAVINLEIILCAAALVSREKNNPVRRF